MQRRGFRNFDPIWHGGLGLGAMRGGSSTPATVPATATASNVALSDPVIDLTTLRITVTSAPSDGGAAIDLMVWYDTTDGTTFGSRQTVAYTGPGNYDIPVSSGVPTGIKVGFHNSVGDATMYFCNSGGSNADLIAPTAPPATAPAPFTTGDADLYDPVIDLTTLRITIDTVPDDGGSALEYLLHEETTDGTTYGSTTVVPWVGSGDYDIPVGSGVATGARIGLRNAIGDSTWFPLPAGLVTPTAVAAPSIAVVTPVTNPPAFTATLTSPAYGDVLRLQYSATSDFAVVLYESTTTITYADISDGSATLSSAPSGGTYYCRCREERGASDSAWSSTISVTVPTTGAPPTYVSTVYIASGSYSTNTVAINSGTATTRDIYIVLCAQAFVVSRVPTAITFDPTGVNIAATLVASENPTAGFVQVWKIPGATVGGTKNILIAYDGASTVKSEEVLSVYVQLSGTSTAGTASKNYTSTAAGATATLAGCVFTGDWNIVQIAGSLLTISRSDAASPSDTQYHDDGGATHGQYSYLYTTSGTADVRAVNGDSVTQGLNILFIPFTFV